MSEGMGPPSDSDDARPCMATGCTWPGRFILGIDGGTSTRWCVRHADVEGIRWMHEFVEGVRGCLPPGWAMSNEPLSDSGWVSGNIQPMADPYKRVPFISDRLVRCDDPDCPDAWAYRDPPADHYHPRPHGPDRPDP